MQAENLQALGAAAVVLVDNQEAGAAEDGDSTPVAPGLGDAAVHIPVVMVTARQGQALAAARANTLHHVTVAVTFSDTEVRMQAPQQHKTRPRLTSLFSTCCVRSSS